MRFEDARTSVACLLVYRQGLKSYLEELLHNEPNFGEPLVLGGVVDGCRVDVAFSWCYSHPIFQSFANRVLTRQGGTHVRGFWQGFLTGLERFMRVDSSLDLEPRRLRRAEIAPYLHCVFGVQVGRPQWASAMKGELASPEARRAVAAVVEEQLGAALSAQTPRQRELLDWILHMRRHSAR